MSPGRFETYTTLHHVDVENSTIQFKLGVYSHVATWMTWTCLMFIAMFLITCCI